MDESTPNDDTDLSERYAKIFRYSNDAIMVVDFGTESFVDVNPAACELLGYDRETLLSLDPSVIHPDDMDRVRESFIADVQQTGSGWTDNLTCITKDGREIPTEVSGATLESEAASSEQTRMIAILRDVSERVRRQRELERQVKRLDRFARTVSHDLRNPLTTLHGQLELARETGKKQHFNKIETTIREIDAILDNVLTLARAESVDKNNLSPVDLETVGTKAWEQVQTANATLRTDAAVNLVADGDQLRELFDNLFRNAVDHGPVDVTVTLWATDDGFVVSDDGPGVPPTEQDQVFEWGYTTIDSGTGFGLAIVADIVAAHGWDIDVSDSEAGGAAFEITGVTFV
ncbi:PAS domain-containing sensor histidine kinase [Halomicroarcula sp. F13]|uniref:histidine kinase n=1 Tax=Haloarcula rubra TaxID=2487747 RepID=A0AAW4PWV2_9EURY|nr:PAS domain-containing sensor histidine kinase [Halomicroarcula rubra]MBX0325518.1 PAS domain-containing sensor histidine kinase [Halomicroarcula rubra]